LANLGSILKILPKRFPKIGPSNNNNNGALKKSASNGCDVDEEEKHRALFHKLEV
jgi:hypothetical protein